jgi:hypothetical protein
MEGDGITDSASKLVTELDPCTHLFGPVGLVLPLERRIRPAVRPSVSAAIAIREDGAGERQWGMDAGYGSLRRRGIIGGGDAGIHGVGKQNALACLWSGSLVSGVWMSADSSEAAAQRSAWTMAAAAPTPMQRQSITKGILILLSLVSLVQP